MRDRKAVNGPSMFWRKSKGHIRDKTISLQALILPNGDVTKEPMMMVECTANYYEQLFAEPEVFWTHSSTSTHRFCPQQRTLKPSPGDVPRGSQPTEGEKEKDFPGRVWNVSKAAVPHTTALLAFDHPSLRCIFEYSIDAGQMERRQNDHPMTRKTRFAHLKPRDRSFCWTRHLKSKSAYF